MDKKIQVRIRDDEDKGSSVVHSYNRMGEISDGYHTFDTLYEYRALLHAAWFNELYDANATAVSAGAMSPESEKAWDLHKSWKHSNGQKCFEDDNYFVVMVELPTGQFSNHYPAEYWDLFHIDEREKASKWDKHTPAEAAERLRKYLTGDWSGVTSTTSS